MTEQKMNDVIGAKQVEVVVSVDGKRLWVNVDEACVLRVCRISGKIRICDTRSEE